MDNFKVGDVVRLKSSSEPHMTITEPNEKDKLTNRGKLSCRWFNVNHELKYAFFSKEELIIVKPYKVE